MPMNAAASSPAPSPRTWCCFEVRAPGSEIAVILVWGQVVSEISECMAAKAAAPRGAMPFETDKKPSTNPKPGSQLSLSQMPQQ